jgi:hypothetical protein
MYAAKLEETRAQIARLHELERELEVSVAYLDACEPCDKSVQPDRKLNSAPGCAEHTHAKAPEVGSCVTCEMRERDQEPELVAGLLSTRPRGHISLVHNEPHPNSSSNEASPSREALKR